MVLISEAEIRTAGGLPEDLISDDDIKHAIATVKSDIEKYLNTSLEPIKQIEFLDGTGYDFFYTKDNPVLRVDYLLSNDTEVSPENLDIDRESGKVVLKKEAEINRFNHVEKNIRVMYWTGLVKKTKRFSTTTSAVSSGSDVTIPLDSLGNIEANNWVDIINVQGQYTSALVKETTSDSIVVDKLLFDIKDDSMVTKLEVPTYIRRFIELECVIYLAINLIGATYTFNTGYSLGDLNVQKGVPYTHWRESLEKALKERNTLKKLIKPRFRIE